MGEVYGYDTQAEEQGLSPEERLRFHQEHSRPVMEKMHPLLAAQFDEKKVEPNSGLGAAISVCNCPPLQAESRGTGTPLWACLPAGAPCESARSPRGSHRNRHLRGLLR